MFSFFSMFLQAIFFWTDIMLDCFTKREYMLYNKLDYLRNTGAQPVCKKLHFNRGLFSRLSENIFKIAVIFHFILLCIKFCYA